jgi:hypothetical protein
VSEKSTRRGTRLCGRVQGGTESLCFSTSNAAWLLQNPQERYNSSESVPKKEIPDPSKDWAACTTAMTWLPESTPGFRELK